MIATFLTLLLVTQSPSDGEARLTLDFKDVSATDLVVLLADAGGRQSVVDGDVHCRLTVKLSGVRWHTAFEHVLRSCALGAEEDGPILRVAPLARLSEEARQRRTLDEERALSQPRSLSLVRLSYARAEELAPILKQALPPGSDVTYDKRTNTLFVTSR